MTYNVLFAAFLLVLLLGYAWPKVSGWRDRNRRSNVLQRRQARLAGVAMTERVRALRQRDANRVRTGADWYGEPGFGHVGHRDLAWAVERSDAGDYLADLLLDDSHRIGDSAYLALRKLAPCCRCRCWGEYCGHNEEPVAV